MSKKTIALILMALSIIPHHSKAFFIPPTGIVILPEEEEEPLCIPSCHVSRYELSGPFPCPDDPNAWCTRVVMDRTVRHTNCGTDIADDDEMCPVSLGDPAQNCPAIRDAICFCRRFNGEFDDGNLVTDECPPPVIIDDDGMN